MPQERVSAYLVDTEPEGWFLIDERSSAADGAVAAERGETSVLSIPVARDFIEEET